MYHSCSVLVTETKKKGTCWIWHCTFSLMASWTMIASVLMTKTMSDVRTSVSKNWMSWFNTASRYLILIVVDCRSPLHIQHEISATTTTTVITSNPSKSKSKARQTQTKNQWDNWIELQLNSLTCPWRSPYSSPHHQEVKCILQKKIKIKYHTNVNLFCKVFLSFLFFYYQKILIC